jgi:hypothetical protein
MRNEELAEDEGENKQPVSIISQTSHEYSCRRITAIRPTIPAANPHNSIKIL